MDFFEAGGDPVGEIFGGGFEGGAEHGVDERGHGAAGVHAQGEGEAGLDCVVCGGGVVSGVAGEGAAGACFIEQAIKESEPGIEQATAYNPTQQEAMLGGDPPL